MGFVRASLLVLFCACTLQLASGQGKVKYSKKVLERVSCGKKEKVKRGDRVTIQMAAHANTDTDSYSSEGTAEQEFVVGRHSIGPINKGVVGMCVGESRRITVVIEQEPGAESDPINYAVKLLRNDNERVIIKEL
mmetsp:Transcript_9944/g.26517  ORF Transcript_9944/g.26517 Transcript_9944/m.26517 type:complete len:135 (+) Transcript_9944:106-510(+)